MVRERTIPLLAVERGLATAVADYLLNDVGISVEIPRDAFVIALCCPHCRTVGEAVLAFDPVGSDTSGRLRVLSVSQGFHVAKLGRTALATEFWCDLCGEVAG